MRKIAFVETIFQRASVLLFESMNTHIIEMDLIGIAEHINTMITSKTFQQFKLFGTDLLKKRLQAWSMSASAIKIPDILLISSRN